MLKRICSVLLVAVLLVCVSGCSALFSNSYRSEQDFQGNEKIDLDANVQVIRNYSELRRLVFGMVNEHTESEELLFSGYTGNVVSDIASVCNAVKTESSYGAYCVDYVSYDLRQIVSSYEARISISYLYTAEELQILQTTSNLDSFAELVGRAMNAEEPKLVVRVNNGTADTETVYDLMEHTARNLPLSISYIPKFIVRIFDGNTSQKIYDVTVQYDTSLDNAARLQQINDVLSGLVSSVSGDSPAENVLRASEILQTHCSYERPAGDTAYDALIDQAANSQGIACAFKAFCDRLGVPCIVVSGRMDKQEHYWNIVNIDDSYYHMDISLMESLGREQSLFLTDSEKQVNCWWDQSEYPECDGELSYLDVF